MGGVPAVPPMETPYPTPYAPGMGLLIVALWLAAETPVPPPPPPAKPACSRELAGRFWPEEANADPSIARDLSRRGGLEICTRTTWSYRWISPTVDARQLRKPR